MADHYPSQEHQQQQHQQLHIAISYRGQALQLPHLSPHSTLLQLGQHLHSLTGVVPHTMRLLLPQSHRSAPSALLPFSDEHSGIILGQSGIPEGRAIRMMGALPDELKEVSKATGQRYEDRIIGFSEEDRRAKRRVADGSTTGRKVPQGSYTFSDFQTLQLSGIKLDPPPEKALEIMHRLASDPGIVAIMNKHRWKVGVMTEMAPVGFVGISPKCLLGYNKNYGEEISLRLRTDDLKGFRKYESIKKTLLHELAHMVHSEHDANFHALDKQLNEEAISLDWTMSKGHTWSGWRHHEDHEPVNAGGVQSDKLRTGYKLGGSIEPSGSSARSAAAAAALRRIENNNPRVQDVVNQNDANGVEIIAEDNHIHIEYDLEDNDKTKKQEPDPDDHVEEILTTVEPDPDDFLTGEPDPDDLLTVEPDPDDLLTVKPYSHEVDEVRKKHDLHEELIQEDVTSKPHRDSTKHNELEPDPDEMDAAFSSIVEPDPDNAAMKMHNLQNKQSGNGMRAEPDPDPDDRTVGIEPDSDEVMVELATMSRQKESENEPSELGLGALGLQSMQESAERVCMRLQQAIAKLRKEATPAEAAAAIQTLFTILRNVMEHPHEAKFKQLRKTNPAFQNRVGKFGGAMEILFTIGFSEGSCDGVGKEDCLILKRNDPGLLWLARSSLEACSA